MAEKIRVRGIISTLDAFPAVAMTFYQEGTRNIVAVGANDILHIDYIQASHESAIATDLMRMYFSDNGVEDAGSTVYIGEMPSSTQATTVAVTLPSPMSGMPGETIYAVAGDTEPMRAIVTGWIYQA